MPPVEGTEENVVQGAAASEAEAAAVVSSAEPPRESGDEFRKGYDAVANPDKEPEVTPPPAEEPPETTKQFSEEEVRSIVSGMVATSEENLRKQLRDANGKIGGLFREIEQMRTAARPAAVAPTALTLNRLKEQFPELAEVLSADLEESFAAPAEKPTQSAEKDAKPTTVDTSVLDELHADWKDYVAEDVTKAPQDYQEWLASLRPSVRLRFLSSNDQYHIAEKLDDFKDWREKKANATHPESKTPAETKAPETAQAASTDSRLEAAVQPTNGTKPPVKGEPSPTERFRAGYQKVAAARYS